MMDDLWVDCLVDWRAGLMVGLMVVLCRESIRKYWWIAKEGEY